MTVTIGSILRGTHAAVRAHFGSFAAIAAAFQLLPLLAFHLLEPGASNPYAMAPAQLGVLVGINLLGFLAMLTFAAVAGEAADAPPRSFGAALADSLVPLLKLIAAAIILYIALSIVAGIIGAVVAIGAVMLMPASSEAAAMVSVLLIVLISAALSLGLAARLSPLPGIYLFEAIGVFRGIRRAWALSRGHAGALLLLGLCYFGLALLLAAPILAAVLPAAALAAGSGDPAAIELPTWLGPYATAAIVPGVLLNIYFGASLGVLYRQLADAER